MSQNAPLHSWLLGVKANVRPIAEKETISERLFYQEVLGTIDPHGETTKIQFRPGSSQWKPERHLTCESAVGNTSFSSDC